MTHVATSQTVRVHDLMTETVITASPGDSLDRLYEVMQDHHIRHIPVVDDDEGVLLGLISHRDLLRHALIEQHDVPRYVEREVLRRLSAGDVMQEVVATAERDQEIRQAAQLMFDNKYGCLPVVEGDRLVGILTEADFVRFLAREGC